MKIKFDLSKIWKMQAELDKTILSSKNKTYENTFHDRLLAFLVELAEFSNEGRFFKYWSNRPESSRNILLEEYIDGIHFIASQALAVNAKSVYEVSESNLDKTNQTLLIFKYASNILDNKNKEYVEKVITYYLQLGLMYKFTQEELNYHYVRKNNINYKRIRGNY